MRWVRSIDTSKAEALPGVKAVVTRDDFHDLPVGVRARRARCWSTTATSTRNVMAREKALYDGHAVAAVAATSERIVAQAGARSLIEVDYEPLPSRDRPVLEAMKPRRADPARGSYFTVGVEPAPDEALERRQAWFEFALGDVESGLRRRRK